MTGVQTCALPISLSFSDKTFLMLYDMIPERVEEYIFLPYLEKLFDECGGEDGYWTYLVHHVGNVHSRCRGILRDQYYVVRGKRSFIGTFIARFPAHSKSVKTSVSFPHYKEFVSRELEIYTGSDGEEYAIPLEYSMIHMPEGFIKTNKMTYEYHFNMSKVAENKTKYPKLISIFESDVFQPYVDYMALKAYYEKLTASIYGDESDSLDFLE